MRSGDRKNTNTTFHLLKFPYFINISMSMQKYIYIYMFLKFLPIMNLMFILQTILFHTCSHLCLTNDLNTRFFG